MKIQTPLIDIKDQLISFISEGFTILGYAFQMPQDQNGVSNMVQEWSNKVHAYLQNTFPTKKRMSDLGAWGDQLVRMIRVSPSKLYVLQSVKPIAHEIIETFEAHIKDLRSKGNHCYYCVIDGQDTATILYAYGFLNKP